MLRHIRIFILAVFLVSFGVAGYASSGHDSVASAPGNICPILIGAPLPEITLKDLSGQNFDLNKAIESKPTVLIYFRGGW